MEFQDFFVDKTRFEVKKSNSQCDLIKSKTPLDRLNSIQVVFEASSSNFMHVTLKLNQISQFRIFHAKLQTPTPSHHQNTPKNRQDSQTLSKDSSTIKLQ
jgi:hypothetical protein